MTAEIEAKHLAARKQMCLNIIANWQRMQYCTDCKGLSDMAKYRVCPYCHSYRFATGFPIVWAVCNLAQHRPFPEGCGTVPRLTTDNQ